MEAGSKSSASSLRSQGSSQINAAVQADSSTVTGGTLALGSGGSLNTTALTLQGGATLATQAAGQLGGRPALVVDTGTLQLLAAEPDGRTMMMCATGQATQNPAIDAALPYRWHDPVPVVRVSASALAFVVRGDSDAASLGELLERVRAAPRAHRIGTSGTGGASILALARLLESAGIALADLGRVTFHGGAAILEAVIDGRSDFAAQFVGEMGSLLRAGRLVPLAPLAPLGEP